MSPNRKAATVPISKQLLMQSSFDVQAFLINVLSKMLGLKVDAYALAQILAAAGVGSVVGGTNGAASTWNNIVDLETAVAAADADADTMSYLTNPKARGFFKKTQKFSGAYNDAIWEDVNSLNNYPANVTNLVSSSLTKGSS